MTRSVSRHQEHTQSTIWLFAVSMFVCVCVCVWVTTTPKQNIPCHCFPPNLLAGESWHKVSANKGIFRKVPREGNGKVFDFSLTAKWFQLPSGFLGLEPTTSPPGFREQTCRSSVFILSRLEPDPGDARTSIPQAILEMPCRTAQHARARETSGTTDWAYSGCWLHA